VQAPNNDDSKGSLRKQNKSRDLKKKKSRKKTESSESERHEIAKSAKGDILDKVDT
jgi:hypothetical protein